MIRTASMLALAFLLSGCAHNVPPTLSPAAQAAFQKTRVIKGLDLLRDTAIAANAQTPPLLSESTTRRVVLAHQSALRAMQASDVGWVPVVRVAVTGVLEQLPANESALLTPYVSLALSLLNAVQP